MQVEVQVPNHEGKLFAGTYAQVRFSLSEENAPIVIPANTFIFKLEDVQVATVTQDNKIHWQNIHVGRDFGTVMEVLDGLKENTRVVTNPTDDLRDGATVEIKPPAKNKEGAGAR